MHLRWIKKSLMNTVAFGPVFKGQMWIGNRQHEPRQEKSREQCEEPREQLGKCRMVSSCL